jgi:pyruvate,water dikinase
MAQGGAHRTGRIEMTTTTGNPSTGRHDSGDGPDGAALVLPLERAIDAGLAGQKAARLAVLRSAGFPVPPGLVVPTPVFLRAVAAAGPNPGQGLRVPEGLSQALARAVAPWGDVPLAVRSSATDEDLPGASYAGLYTTVLDVRGVPSLLDAVRRCWQSAFSTGVAAYRQDREDAHPPRMAVLVQPLLDPTAAGVAFTADPVTGERDRVVLDAVPGRGELLVTGHLTPERWTVRGEDAQRADAQPAAPPALAPRQARAVAELARRVQEADGGRPQDVEWAVVDDQVWLLQARPVTTLPEPPPAQVPVPVEVPDGFWRREASHSALPWTR